MHCEVAVISLTYLVWKKKEEERVFSQQRTRRLDKGLKSIAAPYRVEGGKGRQKRTQLRRERGRGGGRGGGGRAWGHGE